MNNVVNELLSRIANLERECERLENIIKEVRELRKKMDIIGLLKYIDEILDKDSDKENKWAIITEFMEKGKLVAMNI